MIGSLGKEEYTLRLDNVRDFIVEKIDDFDSEGKAKALISSLTHSEWKWLFDECVEEMEDCFREVHVELLKEVDERRKVSHILIPCPRCKSSVVMELIGGQYQNDYSGKCECGADWCLSFREKEEDE